MPGVRKWRRRLFYAAGAAVVIVFVPMIDSVGGTTGCGSVPIRVRGTVVDARSGVPVQGVYVLTLFDPAVAGDPAGLEKRRRIARSYEGVPEVISPNAPTSACAHTAADGSFELIVGLGTSSVTGWSGYEWSRSRGSPYDLVRALLVEKDGYARLVHDTRTARWTGLEGEIAGIFDVGTIRLASR
jgi:hypothetical protein